jgi:hypothetical protein
MYQDYINNDIRWTNSSFIIPDFLPGRLMTDDFIFFDIPDSIDPFSYHVAIESMNTRGPSPYRIISGIQQQVRLPHVYFSPDAKVVVLPRTEGLPVFFGTLKRGSTYSIPKNIFSSGIFPLVKSSSMPVKSFWGDAAPYPLGHAAPLPLQ